MVPLSWQMINHHFNEVILISIFQNNSIRIQIKLSDEKVFLPFIIYEGHINNHREKLTAVSGQKLRKYSCFVSHTVRLTIIFRSQTKPPTSCHVKRPGHLGSHISAADRCQRCLNPQIFQLSNLCCVGVKRSDVAELIAAFRAKRHPAKAKANASPSPHSRALLGIPGGTQHHAPQSSDLGYKARFLFKLRLPR